MTNMTLREKREARQMGYQHRAFFINPHGVPFHKDFMTGDEMEDFIRKAKEAGTKLTGFVSI